MRDHEGHAAEAIDVVAAGWVHPGLPEDLAAHLSRRVSIPCRVGRIGVDGAPPLLAGREQVDADQLLERLEDLGSPDAVVAGVTDLDLGIPIFTFVFGRAREGGRAVLVSTARLDPAFYGLPPDSDLARRRLIDEVLHELGHTAGLRHCRDPACLMRFAGSVEAVDVRGSRFCGACAARLPHWLGGPGSREAG